MNITMNTMVPAFAARFLSSLPSCFFSLRLIKPALRIILPSLSANTRTTIAVTHRQTPMKIIE